MSLSQQQKEDLRRAIRGYDFPAEYFDFIKGIGGRLANTAEVERKIRADLTSGEPERVKDGLSNVLYWGHATVPYRNVRVENFRTKVTNNQLQAACRLFQLDQRPSVLQISKLRLPEFSGLSFVSKVRMFLDPYTSAVLDKQLLKMRNATFETVLSGVSFGENETQIRITQQNAKGYEDWCERMAEISRQYFVGESRAVDIERGFFYLVQNAQIKYAAQILSDA